MKELLSETEVVWDGVTLKGSSSYEVGRVEQKEEASAVTDIFLGRRVHTLPRFVCIWPVVLLLSFPSSCRCWLFFRLYLRLSDCLCSLVTTSSLSLVVSSSVFPLLFFSHSGFFFRLKRQLVSLRHFVVFLLSFFLRPPRLPQSSVLKSKHT